MSTIQHLFNKTVTIRRTRTTNYKREMFTATVAIPIHIQRDENTGFHINDVEAKTAIGWMDINADVKEADQVIASDGRVYRVAEVTQEGDGIAEDEHKELGLIEYPK